MKLEDLPSMLVERIEHAADGVRVEGRFDRLDGVREGGCFRFARGRYAWADLTILDRDRGSVFVTSARDPGVAQLLPGTRYTWLDEYWQPPLVEAIADKTHSWERFEFTASDAAYFKQGNAVGWQQVGEPLPEGAIDLGTKAEGWDHEHCGVCDAHIDGDNPVGYKDDESHFLCERCYDRYGATHDLSFQVGG